MTQQRNIEAQEHLRGAMNRGDLGALDQVVAADCVDHDPALRQGAGPQGFMDMFDELRTAFPDLHIEADHLTATDDDVAFAYIVTGTQQGSLMGHRATGKRMRIRGVQIGRFVDGKLAGRWGTSDQLGLAASA